MLLLIIINTIIIIMTILTRVGSYHSFSAQLSHCCSQLVLRQPSLAAPIYQVPLLFDDKIIMVVFNLTIFLLSSSIQRASSDIGRPPTRASSCSSSRRSTRCWSAASRHLPFSLLLGARSLSERQRPLKFVFFLSLSLSQSSIFPWQMFICSSSPHSRVAERALHLWLGPAR